MAASGMCSSMRRAPPALPSRCGSPLWPSSTARLPHRIPRRRSTAIWYWPCHAAPLGSSRMAARTRIRSPMACFRSIRNCATGTSISATSPVSASSRTGTLSSAFGLRAEVVMAGIRLPRRRLLETAFAGAAMFGAPGLLRGAEPLPPTPQQTAGPFYPQSFPADADNDLVHVAGHAEPAKGTVTRVAGRILDRAGKPVSGARVEIWQCDQNGRYHHVQGSGGGPSDDNFQGFGRTVANADGGYHFLTIRPVPYPGRTPHIHFAVAAPGLQPFVTQMYVEGEPLNERDGLLQSVRDPAARARLIVTLRPAREVAPAALAADFDI